MLRSTNAAHLQSQIEAQLELAQLTPIDKIRAMHEDLERLYRAQLVAVLLAERIAAAPLVATPQNPLWRAACTSTSSNAMVRATISR